MVLDAPPAVTTAHAWMPASPCGASCVQPIDRVGTLRMVGRIFGIVGLLSSFPLAHLATPRSKRAGMQRNYARMLLNCLGIRLRVVDNRNTSEPGYGRAGAGVLVVAGHIGWTDIVALAAVQPLGFVARADLVDWPVLGGLARLMRVIPIERENLRALPGVVDQLGARLAAGERVGIFPEGTTWCGRAYGYLRPALFQAAIDTGTPVQPVRLRYLDRHGAQCTVPAFVGLDTFATSAGRVLRSRGMIAEVVLEQLEAPGADRRELARRCESVVRATPSQHDAFDSNQWIAAGTTMVRDPSATEPVRRRRPILRGRGHQREVVAER